MIEIVHVNEALYVSNNSVNVVALVTFIHEELLELFTRRESLLH